MIVMEQQRLKPPPATKYYVGKGTPREMSRKLAASVVSVEITSSTGGPSLLQMVFRTGRRGKADMFDDSTVTDSSIALFNRIAVVVSLTGGSRCLFDGIITSHEYQPRAFGTQSRFTVTAEDACVMMDLSEKSREHPNQHEATIARKILEEYRQYGISMVTTFAPPVGPPDLNIRVPVQHESDLAYLRRMAARYNFDFFIQPGDDHSQCEAYWGPPVRSGEPSQELRIGLPRGLNVDDVSFQYNGQAPTDIDDRLQARITDAQGPAKQNSSTIQNLSINPALDALRPNVGKRFLRLPQGLDREQADAQAQAMVDRSVQKAVTVSGSLSVGRHGTIVLPRELVKVRGAGTTYSGTYYVDGTTYRIENGVHSQRFDLIREGINS